VIKIVTFKNTQTIPYLMLGEQDLIKKTKLFGLNTYEVKLWVTLLGRGTSTAGELSDMANVPRSRSYDVLESLEKKGFVVMNPGKPIKYLAVPPKEVLENVKKQIEKNMENHLSEIKNINFNNLIDTFQDMYEKNLNTTENVVAVLRGRKNIHKHLNYLVNTQKEAIFSAERSKDEYSFIMEEIKDKAKKSIQLFCNGLRVCIAGNSDVLIFPLSEAEVHPDYDLCIWVKNENTTKFFKQLLAYS
jgi:sugar-specific transcriptional regulator TrmB